jgi:ATP-dependent DNA helicase PIF1
MELSIDQSKALDLFKAGYNMFITGPGGTGKTHLIRLMNKWAIENGKNPQVCAMTGCAARLLECNARTLHSWSGIGLGTGDIASTVRRVVGKKYKKQQLKKADVLIIDEVSMMSLKIFELIDKLLIGAKRNVKPFGGLQIVLVGDFYQLPPVGDANEIETTQFCFESERWAQCIDKIVDMKHVFRQTDSMFAKVINQVRVGRLKKSSFDLLKTRVAVQVSDTIKPTILMPLRRHVDSINQRELSKLDQTSMVKYECAMTIDKEAEDAGRSEPEQIEREYESLKRNLMADEAIDLCVGAQVMCIANIDMESKNQLVNGSQGIIESFNAGLPVVRFRDGHIRTIAKHVWSSEVIPCVGVEQLPLIHAWAITIHKAQGVTLDLAEIDAGQNIFECGQTYVALSRVKTLDGLYLTAFDPSRIKVSAKVQSFYKGLVV